MKELDDFFDAYDRLHVHLPGAGSPERTVLRKNVRRALARPVLQLVWWILLLVVFTVWGILGHPQGYLLAGGTVLAVIPGKIKGIREGIDGVAQLTGVDDLRGYLIEEARKRMASAFLSAILCSGLALLYLLTGAVAAWLARDFRPGLFAGLIVGGVAVYHLLVRLPRAARESNALREQVDDEHEVFGEE